MTKKRIQFEILIGFLWSLAAVLGLQFFNSYILLRLPLIVRMIVLIPLYLCVALVPMIIAIVDKDKWSGYGFTKEKIGLQILIGLGIGLAMSAVLTLLPHLLGFHDMVSSGKSYTLWWQFLYELIYCIAAIGLTEEFVFRGFLYKKLGDLHSNPIFPVLFSSLLFGLLHIFNGVWVQVIMTALIGILWCVLRGKIRHCSTLSLIIAHGVYDFLITVWPAIFAAL